jgi:tetratricopeptide (TPR) repeat protein
MRERDEQRVEELLEQIDPNGEILQDTPQWLNYLYNVGAGGIITEGTQEEINQLEMEYLMRCYNTAVDQNFPFWIANSLQAMSEHLTVPHLRQRLIEDNFISFRNLNINNVPDSILSVDLAQRSLNMFSSYGDVYQKAGSYRTLAQCYRLMGDNEMTLKCLNEALHNDTAINQAPDLVASIWEQLSVIYAALNDKTNSHKYRNKYLDTQDQTRQDRYFESRAEQLSMSINSPQRVARVSSLLMPSFRPRYIYQASFK